MDQEVIADGKESLEPVLKDKLDKLNLEEDSNRTAEPAADPNTMTIQDDHVDRGKSKALLRWQEKLPTKDEESGKAEAPVTEAGKPEESAMDQEVIANGKESLEPVLKDKLDKLDLEEDSNRTAEPAADPNTMTIQDDHVDRGKSALAKKTADEEAKAYFWFRKYWENNCCNNDCDHFEHKTVLSSMQFTHCTPGIVPHSGAETLQIFSMKLKLTDDNAGGFEFPLSVYGMVAVRDTLDSRRNILFSSDRTEAQELTQDNSLLRLTGPSRAIVSMDKVYFEIHLTVKGAAASQDKPLITCARSYGSQDTALCFDNILCRLEVCLQTVKRAVQATIVGVQIVRKKESWPSNFTYGGLVACTPLPRKTADSGGNQTIVLVESKGREIPQGVRGYVHLWRQVVSVESGGGLDVVIQAYKESGAVGAQSHIHFTAQDCHMSQKQCTVGQAQVTVTVAWSVVPTDMDDLVYNF